MSFFFHPSEQKVVLFSGTHPWRHRQLTLHEALQMPLPEPDPPKAPQPDSIEGMTKAYRTFPAGGVMAWEKAPGGQLGLNETIKQFADAADNKERR